MPDLDKVQRLLKLSIERLERAESDLAHVTAIQGTRADIERVLAGFSARSTVHVDNPASVLRAAGKILEPIDNVEALRAWADVIAAATLLEESTNDGPA